MTQREATHKRSLGDNTMKKLFTTVALVALVATPVLAQTKDRPSQRARAQAPQTSTTQQQQRALAATHNVYDVRGQYVGSDPDSRIRAQMANDPTQVGD
jgi:Ni/Co efflux regulator RcnB